MRGMFLNPFTFVYDNYRRQEKTNWTTATITVNNCLCARMWVVVPAARAFIILITKYIVLHHQHQQNTEASIKMHAPYFHLCLFQWITQSFSCVSWGALPSYLRVKLCTAMFIYRVCIKCYTYIEACRSTYVFSM